MVAADDAEIKRRMIEWVRAWKIDPAHPSRALPSSVKQKDDPIIKFGPRYDYSSEKVGGEESESEEAPRGVCVYVCVCLCVAIQPANNNKDTY